MRRVFNTQEDQRLFNRWVLGLVVAYSMAALMVVLVTSLSVTSRDTTIATRLEPAAFAWSVERTH